MTVHHNLRAPSRSRARLLVVDDDGAMCDLLREELEDEGYEVDVASSGRTALDRVRKGGIDLVVSDVRMPDLDGLDLLREIQAVAMRPHVITITGFGSIDTAIRAVKLGAYDYITKPFELRELLVTIEKALGERAERTASSIRVGEIVARAPVMLEIVELVRRLSESTAGVLITGESGTGKELIARTMHARSARRERPFITVGCAAIPEADFETELFGRGGPDGDRQGAFLEADGGTLFLDEVAEMPLHVQPKVLRVISDREIRPPGFSRAVPIDVRVVAATHRELEPLMKQGRFREDLFYRLNIVEMALPPLRERREDIVPLAEHFLTRSATRAGKPARGFAEDVRPVLQGYNFPGNVRELENLVERMVALSTGFMIRMEDLPAALRERRNADRLAEAMAKGLTLDELERQYIERILEAEGGNKTRAALRLGLDRRTLYRKLDEYAQSVQREGGPAGDPPKQGGNAS
jgi:two-component system response regulator HydG